MSGRPDIGIGGLWATWIGAPVFFLLSGFLSVFLAVAAFTTTAVQVYADTPGPGADSLGLLVAAFVGAATFLITGGITALGTWFALGRVVDALLRRAPGLRGDVDTRVIVLAPTRAQRLTLRALAAAPIVLAVLVPILLAVDITIGLPGLLALTSALGSLLVTALITLRASTLRAPAVVVRPAGVTVLLPMRAPIEAPWGEVDGVTLDRSRGLRLLLPGRLNAEVLARVPAEEVPAIEALDDRARSTGNLELAREDADLQALREARAGAAVEPTPSR